MALIQDTYLTDKGFEIANKAANGQTSFTITKVVSSDQNINDKSKDEIKKLNNLDNEINSGQIIDTDVRSSNLTGIVTQFGNDIYTKGYEVGAIAMYAKENNSNNEFLYAVTPMVENEKVPAVDTNVFLGFQVTIYVVAGDSQRMDVSLSKGGDASVDLVEKLISNSESGIQKKLDNKANISYVDDSRDKAIQQSSQYTDNKYNDLQNKTNDLSKRIDDTNNHISTGVDNAIQQANQSTKQLANNKVTDNHDGTIQFNGENQAISKSLNPCNLNDIKSFGTYIGNNEIKVFKNAPSILNSKWSNYFVLRVQGQNSANLTQIITGGTFAPQYRNLTVDGWSQWYQLADTDYVNNQIASIKKNSWRELEIDGSDFNGNVFCKLDWNNYTATISGYIYNNANEFTLNYYSILPSSDFSFKNNFSQDILSKGFGINGNDYQTIKTYSGCINFSMYNHVVAIMCNNNHNNQPYVDKLVVPITPK